VILTVELIGEIGRREVDHPFANVVGREESGTHKHANVGDRVKPCMLKDFGYLKK
jgi:hypothetical protein